MSSLSEPILIDTIQFVRVREFTINGRLPILCKVIGTAAIDSGDIKPPPHDELSDELIGVYSETVTLSPESISEIAEPNVELLISFPPIPGHGAYNNLIRTTILFWRNEYWTHSLNHSVTGDQRVDVLYRVKVLDANAVPLDNLFDQSNYQKLMQFLNTN